MKDTHHLVVGLLIRLILTILLPSLLDDGLLLKGVRYTDIDYAVFTDAGEHVARGESPYERHTYRYTPFLAGFLALPHRYDIGGMLAIFMSTKYFGKILFCIADAICGYIIALLRRRRRAGTNEQHEFTILSTRIRLSTDFVDALWWLYNPLPINICTRGSAESLVVLLPVLATVVVAESTSNNLKRTKGGSSKYSIILRACIAGVFHGVGIHAKLYPVIYTVSFMAYFSHQQQSVDFASNPLQQQAQPRWTNLLSEQMQYVTTCLCCGPSQVDENLFPWRHPLRIFVLAILWVERLFFTMSSM